MKPERFKNSPAGNLVQRIDTENKRPYWAFTPNPLPPKFEWTPELWMALSDADRALGELAGVGHQLVNPQLLLGPFIRREAVLSSRIEGTQAGITDLYAYQAGQLAIPGIGSQPPEWDVREVLNYVNALEYGLRRVETLAVGRILMCELHDRLMQAVRGGRVGRGHFRDFQNWIGRRGFTNAGQADFVPPPVPEMHDALDQLESYINSDDALPPLIRIGLIHYQFETIHPFGDGNGRIGRLLISLLIGHWKLLPLPLLYLSAYFAQHRDTYCDLLLAVSEQGAWTEWLTFFVRGVAEQSRDATLRAKRLQDLQLEWRRQVQQPRTSGLLLGIIDLLFDIPIVSAQDVRQRFDVSHQGAMDALRRLEEKGILKEMTGRERFRIFMARQILDLLENDELG